MIREKLICSSCGGDLIRPFIPEHWPDGKKYFQCFECNKIIIPVIEEEWKNINRTELIDKMLYEKL
jgi:hypothetical protein